MSDQPSPSSSTHGSSLADLIDLRIAIEREATDEHRHRDRQIGRNTEALRDQPSAQARAWLDQVQPRREGSPGRRAASVTHLIGMALTVFGLVVGVSVAGGLFAYQPGGRVNVLHVLAVFVALQWAMLVLMTLAWLTPASMTHRWLAPWRTVAGWFSPGVWAQRVWQGIADWRGRNGDSSGPEFDAALIAPLIDQRELMKWLAIGWSQSFAAWFNVGALATVVCLVVVTDVAFGWSTTLQVEPSGVHRITEALAWPWRSIWPDARPSIELIEATRHFRTGDQPVADPQQLGGWWPFVVMSMLVYGLAPRLVTWAWARWTTARQMRLQWRRTWAEHLDARLNRPLVAVDSGPDVASKGGMADDAGPDAPAERQAAQRCVVINWADASPNAEPIDAEVRRVISPERIEIHDAGGSRSLKDDRHVVESLDGLGRDDVVIVLVRSWEPPMADLADWLSEVSGCIGSASSVWVHPLGLPNDGAFDPPRELDVKQWRRWVHGLKSSAIQITARAGEGA